MLLAAKAAAGAATPWISYIISAFALLVSAASFWNAYRARQEGRKHRREAIYQAEFDRQIRTPVEAELTQILTIQKTLVAIPLTGKIRALGDIRRDAQQHVHEAHAPIQALLDTLDHANTTRFAEGADWLSDAEPCHDELLEADNAIAEADSFDNLMAAVTQASNALARMVSTVRDRINQQLLDHIDRQ